MSSTAPANAADQDLDNLIFSEKKDGANAIVNENSQPQGDDHDSDSDDKDKKQGGPRASIANVLPVDKLKNGASVAAGCVTWLCLSASLLRVHYANNGFVAVCVTRVHYVECWARASRCSRRSRPRRLRPLSPRAPARLSLAA